MATPSSYRPVIGAICFPPGRPETLRTLRLIKDLGLTACETLLFRGDTSPRRRKEVLAFLDEAARIGVSVMLETQYEPDLDAHPDARNVTSQGKPSTRRNGFCYRNPAYLTESDRFTVELCRHYMGHPAILRHHGRPVLAVGHELQYQVAAEDGHGGTVAGMTCYCAHCVRGFTRWLRTRYADSVDAYNEAHRRTIRRWSDVAPPRRPRPGRLLWQEWTDFHAEAIPDVLVRQRAIIEREVPGALVTHEINDWYPNTWDCVYTGDHFWKMGKALEHAFNDQYPMEWKPGSLWRMYLYTFTQDVTQSAIGFERSFWTNGQAFPSWQGDTTEPPVEGHREQVYSALIHGANGLFWWTGGDLLSGTKEANAEYRHLVELLGDTRPVKDPVALLVPWTTYAQTRSPDRGDDLMGGYQLLSRLGYQIEAVDEGQVEAGVLTERGYRALCTWGNSSVTMEARQRIEQFVLDGGLLLADYGDVDTQPFGPPFPEAISPRGAGSPAYVLPDGSVIAVRARSQALRRPKEGDVIARYPGGRPAIVRRRHGAGILWRAGSLIGVDYASGMGIYDWVHQERVRIEPSIESLVGAELGAFELAPVGQADNPNVEVGLFRLDDCVVLLAVNHLRHTAKVNVVIRLPSVGTSARDVFTGEAVTCTAVSGGVSVPLRIPELGGRAVFLLP